VAQALECLLSKHKALTPKFKPSLTKKQNNKQTTKQQKQINQEAWELVLSKVSPII
jgi:hypothetical protein